MLLRFGGAVFELQVLPWEQLLLLLLCSLWGALEPQALWLQQNALRPSNLGLEAPCTLLFSLCSLFFILTLEPFGTLSLL